MLAENLLGTANSCPSRQPLIEEKNCDSQPIETDEKKIDGDAMDKDASTELLSG